MRLNITEITDDIHLSDKIDYNIVEGKKKDMNKEIQIYAFADEASPDIDGQIQAMKRNGLNGLEIRGVDGESVANITLEKAKEVKKKMDDNGLIVWSVGSPIGKINIEGDDFSAHMDTLKHTLEVANVLNAENMRMFSFYMPEGKDASVYKEEVIERLGRMCDLAKDYRVNLCHENEKGIYGDIPERCLEIHQALPQMKGIFDPANFVQCDVDTLKAWEILKDYIYYMHIKDAKWNGTVVPAGMGDGHLSTITHSFCEKGGKAFTIEPHLKVFEGFSHLERANAATDIPESVYKDSNTAFDAACNAFKKLF